METDGPFALAAHRPIVVPAGVVQRRAGRGTLLGRVALLRMARPADEEGRRWADQRAQELANQRQPVRA